MESVEYSEKFLKERRMMVVLPVLVVPFLTILFVTFGGGRANGTKNEAAKENALNMALPAANEKDAVTDKLALYDKADRDSLDLRGRMESDPYFRQQYPQAAGAFATSTGTPPLGSPQAGIAGYQYHDPAEARVYERLNALNTALAQPGTAERPVAPSPPGPSGSGVSNADINRLQAMMQQMQAGGPEDQETKNLNGMLESILDIQHPERVRERLKKESRENRGRVYAVSGVPPATGHSLLDSLKGALQLGAEAGFFGKEEASAAVGENAIEAVVHQQQVVTTGSVLKLRLTADVYVNGIFIPRGQAVFGKVALAGERLTVNIENIRNASSLLPVKLAVYDIDGLEGIHIPGAIGREVAKESGDRGIQQLGMATLDPSLGAQAMSVGIEAGKSLLSRKVKLVKVTVKAGYKVLLKDENNREF